MVVVLPAPLGPSRPKHSPRGDLQVEAADRLDGRPAGVRLDQLRAADRGVHGGQDSDAAAGRVQAFPN